MPPQRCPHCDSDTLALTGWSAVAHCASCGRGLGNGAPDPERAIWAKTKITEQRLVKAPGSGRIVHQPQSTDSPSENLSPKVG
jgi:hypothetical protein